MTWDEWVDEFNREYMSDYDRNDIDPVAGPTSIYCAEWKPFYEKGISPSDALRKDWENKHLWKPTEMNRVQVVLVTVLPATQFKLT